MTTHLPANDADLRVGVIVLCGGRSRRMGESKAWLRFGSETLLQRIVGRLLDVKGPLVVVKAREQALPELPTSVRIIDDSAADRGPLQGLATGLEALQNEVDLAFVSSTDAPYIDRALISLLESFRRPNDDVLIPRAHGRLHPLAALYAMRVLPEVQEMLSSDQLRLTDLLHHVRTHEVLEEDLRRIDPKLRCLLNVNTPEAYQLALAEKDDP